MIKLVTRTAAVVIVIGAIVGAFAAIQLPTPDYSFFSQMVGKGYAIMSHWVPSFPALWSFTTLILGAWLSIKGMQFVVYASSIVLKIFE
ncbi:hypothetical protein IJG29_03820 [Candidatus Saccharibacteria bacterium]|nr:hypothetical protein [Candidatus Saccharibacteria bacterium]